MVININNIIIKTDSTSKTDVMTSPQMGVIEVESGNGGKIEWAVGLWLSGIYQPAF